MGCYVDGEAERKKRRYSAELRELKRKRRRRLRATLAAILIVLICVSGIVAYDDLNKSALVQAVSFKAAIVDELSGTFPDPSFNNEARAILVGAGYTVDYFGPNQTTVDFYSTLASRGYGVIIIRAHSTGWVAGSQVTIFTSEPYSQTSHVYEQLTDEVGSGYLTNTTRYFLIGSKFVQDVMQGRFPNSIIMMMGCTGLKDSEMAQAFVAKGAEVYISWNKSVTSDRTDSATIALLRSLAQGKTVGQAVSNAMDEVGPDPTYNSTLGYYPADGATLVISLRPSGMTESSQGVSEAWVSYGPSEAIVPSFCRCRP